LAAEWRRPGNGSDEGRVGRGVFAVSHRMRRQVRTPRAGARREPP